MIVRRLTPDHDMTFGNGLADYAERAEAVAQNVKTRLILLQEEWFLDLSAGVPWLQKIMVKPARLLLANTIIKRTMLKTDGVTKIVSYSTSFDRETRRLNVAATLNTIYDETIDIQVSK